MEQHTRRLGPLLAVLICFEWIIWAVPPTAGADPPPPPEAVTLEGDDGIDPTIIIDRVIPLGSDAARWVYCGESGDYINTGGPVDEFVDWTTMPPCCAGNRPSDAICCAAWAAGQFIKDQPANVSTWSTVKSLYRGDGESNGK